MDSGSASPPAWMAQGRIPSLDGLRAVSIIVVTLAHAIVAVEAAVPASWNGIRRYGSTGVDVFFVISGFLITHLLLKELGRSGTISLKDFYIRRTFRIMPAYYASLGVAALLVACGGVRVEPNVWLPATTFTFNLVPGLSGRLIGQIWSLCVEEHFYLLWPAALLFVGRRRGPMILLAFIIAAVPLRFIIWTKYQNFIDIDYFTFTRIDTIAVGCLLAFIAHDPRCWSFLRRIEGRGDWLALAGVAMLLVSKEVLGMSGKYILGPRALIESGSIALILLAMVSDPRSLLGRLLNCRPMVAIGVLSYSLYLGQMFSSISKSPGWPLGWAWNVPLVFAYALASYYLIERPFLRWKDYARAKRAGRPALLPDPAA